MSKALESVEGAELKQLDLEAPLLADPITEKIICAALMISGIDIEAMQKVLATYNGLRDRRIVDPSLDRAIESHLATRPSPSVSTADGGGALPTAKQIANRIWLVRHQRYEGGLDVWEDVIAEALRSPGAALSRSVGEEHALLSLGGIAQALDEQQMDGTAKLIRMNIEALKSRTVSPSSHDADAGRGGTLREAHQKLNREFPVLPGEVLE